MTLNVGPADLAGGERSSLQRCAREAGVGVSCWGELWGQLEEHGAQVVGSKLGGVGHRVVHHHQA